MLAELGIEAEGEPDRVMEVWNKADLLDAAALKRIEKEAKKASSVLVSAVTGYGLTTLLAEIERRLNRARDTLKIAVNPQEGALSNWIYENSEVIDREDLGDGVTALRIRIAPEKRERLARLAGTARLKRGAE